MKVDACQMLGGCGGVGGLMLQTGKAKTSPPFYHNIFFSSLAESLRVFKI